MANKEIKIGEVGIIDGVKVKCVKSIAGMCGFDDGKTPCQFYEYRCIEMNCSADNRHDKTDVFYSKVEE